MMHGNLRLGVLVGLLLSCAILISNVLLPLVIGHPSPDNEFSESIGWSVVIALICWIGFVKVRRTSRIRDSVTAGAVISFVAFAMAMATFLIIDNLFLTTVAQQPEKVWLFEHSRFANMRAYLNYTNLRAFWTVLPIVTAAGAICGLAGGSLNLFVPRRNAQ